MVTESFAARECALPKTEVYPVLVKKYEEQTVFDSEGVAHTSLVEKTKDDFLDVPFREFSIQSMIATGEVNRLKFVSPHSFVSLDFFDRVTGDADMLSAKLDSFEAMESAAEAARASRESNSNVEQ